MSHKKQEYYVKKFSLCDRNHFLILKGIAALAAVIALFFRSYYDFNYASYIVHGAAAVFFFCSGFGVSESYRHKSGLSHYWENKMVKVWLPSAIMVIALNVVRKGNFASWIAHSPLGLMDNWLYLTFGCYGAFWVIFKLMDNKVARLISLFACSAVAFVLLPEDMAIKLHVFAFPVGVLLSQIGWKHSMMDAGWGKRIAVLGIAIVAGAAGALLASLIRLPYLRPFGWSVCFLSVAVSLVLATYYLKKVPVFGVFAPFGMISYGLYLLYDGVFDFFGSRQDWKMHMVMFCILLAGAVAISALRELLARRNRKMRRRERRR